MNKKSLLYCCSLFVISSLALVLIAALCEFEQTKELQRNFYIQKHGYHDLRPATLEELQSVYNNIDSYYYNYYTAVSRGEKP
jgi:outer membrane lipoprotein-sorting protein